MDYSQHYLMEFKKYISLQTASVNTIKNYLSDLRLFLFFITQNQHLLLDPQTLPSFINQEFIDRYEQFLAVTNPPTTTKRRISSLKKFIDYCATQGIYPALPAYDRPSPTSVSQPPIQNRYYTEFPQTPPAYTPPPPVVTPQPTPPPQIYTPGPMPVSPPPVSYQSPVSPPVYQQETPAQVITPPPLVQPPATPDYPSPPVNPPSISSPEIYSVPEPQSLVHNFMDLDNSHSPQTSVTSQPASYPTPQSGSDSVPGYLPVLVSVLSLIFGFVLTLFINYLFFR